MLLSISYLMVWKQVETSVLKVELICLWLAGFWAPNDVTSKCWPHLCLWYFCSMGGSGDKLFIFIQADGKTIRKINTWTHFSIVRAIYLHYESLSVDMREAELWTILQPANRRWSRCFGFPFEEPSCCPSLFHTQYLGPVTCWTIHQLSNSCRPRNGHITTTSLKNVFPFSLGATLFQTRFSAVTDHHDL